MVKPRAPPSGTVAAVAAAASRRAIGRNAEVRATVAMAPASTAIPAMLAAVCTTSPTVVGSYGGSGHRSVHGTVPDVAARRAAPPRSTKSK